MIVGGIFHAGMPARPALSQAAQGTPAGIAAEETDLRPTYFRSISSISPGSLASAYQAMRAHGAAGVSPDPAAVPAGEPAILSGLGIPSALDAYREVLDEG